MKISFIADSRQVYSRYIWFLVRSIQIGKYPKGGFVVLPYLLKNASKAVYFPDHKLTSDILEEIARFQNYSLTSDFPPKTLAKLDKLTKGHLNPDSSNLMQEWQTQKDAFIKSIYSHNYFKGKLPQDIEIQVFLTDIGTTGSFSYKKIQDKYQVLCTSRIDMGLENISKTIFQSLLTICDIRGDVGTHQWHVRNSLVDFFFTKDNSNSQVTPNHYQQSFDYLKKLGYFTNSQELSSKIHDQLTIQEKKLFSFLVSQNGRLVSFDDCAKSLWGDDWTDKFSLEALAKIIQNLRSKIKLFTMSTDPIKTFRKQGYLLNI